MNFNKRKFWCNDPQQTMFSSQHLQSAVHPLNLQLQQQIPSSKDMPSIGLTLNTAGMILAVRLPEDDPLGYPAAALIKRSLLSLVHPNVQKAKPLIQQVANQCAIAIRQARLYQAAQAQVAELEKLNRLKDDFLSTVSYELRTPMSNMKMAIQMLALALNQDTAFLSELAKPQAERSKAARYLT
jgi:signal transduction histidine kinase